MYVREYNEEPSLTRYLQEIDRIPLLSVEEEVNLFRRIRISDQDAFDKLIRSNLKFVVCVAKKYRKLGLPFEDLINEGNLGLIEAAKRFDETRGFKFISYAVWWIRQSILKALAEKGRIVRLPSNRIEELNKIDNVYRDLEQIYGRKPTSDEIADQLHMNTENVLHSLMISGKSFSLDTPPKEEMDVTLLDLINDGTEPAPDQPLSEESFRSDIDRTLEKLTIREAEVVRLSFGIGTEGPMTLEEIGNRFDLTRERIRQIKNKAIEKLKEGQQSEDLRIHLGEV